MPPAVLPAGTTSWRTFGLRARRLRSGVEVAGDHDADGFDPAGHFTHRVEAAFGHRFIGFRTRAAGRRAVVAVVSVVEAEELKPLVILRKRTADGAEGWSATATGAWLLVTASAAAAAASTATVIAALLAIGVLAAASFRFCGLRSTHVSGGRGVITRIVVALAWSGFALGSRLRPTASAPTAATASLLAWFAIFVHAVGVSIERLAGERIDVFRGLVVILGRPRASSARAVFVVVISRLPAFTRLVAASARAAASASTAASAAWFLVGGGFCGRGGCFAVFVSGARFVVKSVRQVAAGSFAVVAQWGVVAATFFAARARTSSTATASAATSAWPIVVALIPATFGSRAIFFCRLEVVGVTFTQGAFGFRSPGLLTVDDRPILRWSLFSRRAFRVACGPFGFARRAFPGRHRGWSGRLGWFVVP